MPPIVGARRFAAPRRRFPPYLVLAFLPVGRKALRADEGDRSRNSPLYGVVEASLPILPKPDALGSAPAKQHAEPGRDSVSLRCSLASPTTAFRRNGSARGRYP